MQESLLTGKVNYQNALSINNGIISYGQLYCNSFASSSGTSFLLIDSNGNVFSQPQLSFIERDFKVIKVTNQTELQNNINILGDIFINAVHDSSLHTTADIVIGNSNNTSTTILGGSGIVLNFPDIVPVNYKLLKINSDKKIIGVDQPSLLSTLAVTNRSIMNGALNMSGDTIVLDGTNLFISFPSTKQYIVIDKNNKLSTASWDASSDLRSLLVKNSSDLNINSGATKISQGTLSINSNITDTYVTHIGSLNSPLEISLKSSNVPLIGHGIILSGPQLFFNIPRPQSQKIFQYLTIDSQNYISSTDINTTTDPQFNTLTVDQTTSLHETSIVGTINCGKNNSQVSIGNILSNTVIDGNQLFLKNPHNAKTYLVLNQDGKTIETDELPSNFINLNVSQQSKLFGTTTNNGIISLDGNDLHISILNPKRYLTLDTSNSVVSDNWNSKDQSFSEISVNKKANLLTDISLDGAVAINTNSTNKSIVIGSASLDSPISLVTSELELNKKIILQANELKFDCGIAPKNNQNINSYILAIDSTKKIIAIPNTFADEQIVKTLYVSDSFINNIMSSNTINILGNVNTLGANNSITTIDGTSFFINFSNPKPYLIIDEGNKISTGNFNQQTNFFSITVDNKSELKSNTIINNNITLKPEQNNFFITGFTNPKKYLSINSSNNKVETIDWQSQKGEFDSLEVDKKFAENDLGDANLLGDVAMSLKMDVFSPTTILNKTTMNGGCKISGNVLINTSSDLSNTVTIGNYYLGSDVSLSANKTNGYIQLQSAFLSLDVTGLQIPPAGKKFCLCINSNKNINTIDVNQIPIIVSGLTVAGNTTCDISSSGESIFLWGNKRDNSINIFGNKEDDIVKKNNINIVGDIDINKNQKFNIVIGKVLGPKISSGNDKTKSYVINGSTVKLEYMVFCTIGESNKDCQINLFSKVITCNAEKNKLAIFPLDPNRVSSQKYTRFIHLNGGHPVEFSSNLPETGSQQTKLYISNNNIYMHFTNNIIDNATRLVAYPDRPERGYLITDYSPRDIYNNKGLKNDSYSNKLYSYDDCDNILPVAYMFNYKDAPCQKKYGYIAEELVNSDHDDCVYYDNNNPIGLDYNSLFIKSMRLLNCISKKIISTQDKILYLKNCISEIKKYKEDYSVLKNLICNSEESVI